MITVIETEHVCGVKAGLDNITQKVLSLKEGKSSTTARVEILNAKGQKVGTADFIYALDKNGALKVSTTFEPDTALCEINSSLGGNVPRG